MDTCQLELKIGYWLSAGSMGQGPATESASALTVLAFANPEIERVEIHYDSRNLPSVRVPQRLGYRIESKAEGELGEPGVWSEVVDTMDAHSRHVHGPLLFAIAAVGLTMMPAGV